MGHLPEDVKLTISSIRDPDVRCTRAELSAGTGGRDGAFVSGDFCTVLASFEISRACEAGIAVFELVLHEDLMRAVRVKQGVAVSRTSDGSPGIEKGSVRIEFRQRFQLDLVPDTYAVRLTLYLGNRTGEEPEVMRDAIWLAQIKEKGLVASWYSNAIRVLEVVPEEHSIPVMPYLSIGGPSALPRALDVDESFPALLHLTHQKAGSQWVLAILRDLFPDRMVAPQPDHGNVFAWGIRSGCVYPTIYFSRPELCRLPLPQHYKIFFVMRDLRDTLVSMYFSFRGSHPTAIRDMARLHSALNSLSFEDGMLLLIETWLGRIAMVQMSWIDEECCVVRYEDLLEVSQGKGLSMNNVCTLARAPGGYRQGAATQAASPAQSRDTPIE